jgi:hypothetical protein
MHLKTLAQEGWKWIFSMNLIGNPKHAFARFNVGSYKSLIEDPEAYGKDIVY